jgi:hypothetical protein
MPPVPVWVATAVLVRQVPLQVLRLVALVAAVAVCKLLEQRELEPMEAETVRLLLDQPGQPIRAAAVVVLAQQAALAAPVLSSFASVPHKQSDNERKRAWLTLHA